MKLEELNEETTDLEKIMKHEINKAEDDEHKNEELRKSIQIGNFRTKKERNNYIGVETKISEPNEGTIDSEEVMVYIKSERSKMTVIQ